MGNSIPHSYDTYDTLEDVRLAQYLYFPLDNTVLNKEVERRICRPFPSGIRK